MRTRKSFLSAFSSLIVIPTIVIIILIDKPDYKVFDFIYNNTIPVAEAVGQVLTYPVRLVGGWINDFRQNRVIMRENAEMYSHLQQAMGVAIENEILIRENALLKEKLGIIEQSPNKMVAADIVRDTSFAGHQSFMIENSNGLLDRGNVAVSNGGFFLGMISDIVGHRAQLRSARDSGSNIPVRIAGTNVFGFLAGFGNNDPELKFLSDGDFIPAKGMILITSGVNGNIPSGIPVGRIKDVRGDDITVTLGADLVKQESVFVILFGPSGKYE